MRALMVLLFLASLFLDAADNYHLSSTIVHDGSNKRGDISALFFSADGKDLFVANLGGSIARYDVASGRLQAESEAIDKSVLLCTQGLRLSSDSKWLAAKEASQSGVRLFDAVTLKQKKIKTNGGWKDVFFSKDNNLIVFEQEGRSVIRKTYDLNTNKVVAENKIPENLELLRIMQNGKSLLLKKGEKVSIWTIDPLECQREYCLGWLPDVAESSQDNKYVFMKNEKREEFCVLNPKSGAIFDNFKFDSFPVCYTVMKDTLFAVHEKNSINLYDLRSGNDLGQLG